MTTNKFDKFRTVEKRLINYTHVRDGSVFNDEWAVSFE
jgi:hypothetical protein